MTDNKEYEANCQGKSGEDYDMSDFRKSVHQRREGNRIPSDLAEVDEVIDRLRQTFETPSHMLLALLKKENPWEVVNMEEQDWDESLFLSTITRLLQNGASPDQTDDDGNSDLFYAVKFNRCDVARKLISYGATVDARNNNNEHPLQQILKLEGKDEPDNNASTIGQESNNLTSLLPMFVLDRQKSIVDESLVTHEEMIELLVKECPKDVVRNYFFKTGKERNSGRNFRFKDLFQNKMTKTILHVFDSLIEEKGNGEQEVYLSLLDTDKKGVLPLGVGYEQKHKTAIHRIAMDYNTELASHKVVRLMLIKKWYEFARFREIRDALLYAVFLMTLTFSLVVGIDADDPLKYDDTLQHLRGAAEVAMCFVVIYRLYLEITKFQLTGWHYWKDAGNWIDLAAIVTLILTVPLRFMMTRISWPVFGMGYFLWVMRSFRFASLHRSTGTFAYILWSILTLDMVHFVIVSFVVILAFSGLLVTGLKYDGVLGDDYVTASFWATLLMSWRTLIEQGPVLDYVGEGRFGTFSIGVMLLLLFATLTVLLNILIARLSDAYEKIQKDAEGWMDVQMAWIVTRCEQHELVKNHRKLFYKKYKMPMTCKLNEELKCWYGEDEFSKESKLAGLEDRLDRQENVLHDIQDKLNKLINAREGDSKDDTGN